MQSFHVGVVNLNSLINKINFVSNLLVEKDLYFLAICETWLIGDVSSSFVAVPGYTFLKKDVDSSVRKHGVGLYLKSGLEAVPVEIDVPNVLGVYIPLSDLYVVVVYRPPSNGDEENGTLARFVVDFSANRNVLMLGDFNLPSLRWNESGGVADGYITPLDRSFYESFLEAGLTQIVHLPTFVASGNTLDLILVSNSEMVGDLEVLPPLPHCQHCPVVVRLFLADTQDTSVRSTVRLWSKGNYPAICRELEGVDWESLFEGLSVDDCYIMFLDTVVELILLLMPT